MNSCTNTIDINKLLRFLMDLYYAVLAKTQAHTAYKQYSERIRSLLKSCNDATATYDALLQQHNAATVESHSSRITYQAACGAGLDEDTVTRLFNKYIDRYGESATKYLDVEYCDMVCRHNEQCLLDIRGSNTNDLLSSQVLLTHRNFVSAYSAILTYIRLFIPNANTITVYPDELQVLMNACYTYSSATNCDAFWTTFGSYVRTNYIW
jgi:hypothetical protein